VLETYSSTSEDWTIVRRGSRMDEYVATRERLQHTIASPQLRALCRHAENGRLLSQGQVLRGDRGAVAQQGLYEEHDTAYDAHRGSSVRIL
jgi:hypothetical protein